MAALIASVTAAACELSEVVIPAASDLLVVEAVLRVGSRQQYIILHRSMEGRVVRGEPDASVVVVTDDGRRISYEQADILACLFNPTEDWGVRDIALEASCYVSPREAGRFVQPGRAYELEVETNDGLVVRGRTQAPGVLSYRTPSVQLDPVNLAVACAIPSRPFELVWSRAEGAWSYVVSMQITHWSSALHAQGIEAPDPLELTSVSVSAADTSLLFPAEVGLFQRADLDERIFFALREGLPPGTATTLVVLAADRNYTNAIRGGRFNPSGNVRLSSVAGDAVGIFGSVVPITIRSSPDPEGAPPPCPVP